MKLGPSRLEELIRRFRDVLESSSGLRLPPLEPATEDEIELAAAELGRALPEDLKALYRTANSGHVLSWEVLPVSTMSGTRRSAEDWQEVLDVLEESRGVWRRSGRLHATGG